MLMLKWLFKLLKPLVQVKIPMVIPAIDFLFMEFIFHVGVGVMLDRLVIGYDDGEKMLFFMSEDNVVKLSYKVIIEVLGWLVDDEGWGVVLIVPKGL